MNKVFLGGTCNGSSWREWYIPMLKINYFNPVVEDWTEESKIIEEREKSKCNVHLYVITNEMKGVYSIAEAVESTFLTSTIFHVIPEGFDKAQLKSLSAVCELINRNGGIALMDNSFSASAKIINESYA